MADDYEDVVQQCRRFLEAERYERSRMWSEVDGERDRSEAQNVVSARRAPASDVARSPRTVS
ncbi:MAG: hypothetical protein ACRD1T_17205, partial [Acidimicrobiia bacterium]